MAINTKTLEKDACWSINTSSILTHLLFFRLVSCWNETFHLIFAVFFKKISTMSFFDNLFRKKSVPDAIATASSDGEHGTGLNKSLGLWDLTAFGIAAIIGAGIFSTIGKASFSGGPGVLLLFIFTAVACGFAAFAYAEFASLLPVSGSAYTYSYVAFGELIAWIIGWALLMEYAVGNIVVAVSWSGYFTSLCDSIGFHVPEWAQIDYSTAKGDHAAAQQLLAAGKEADITARQREATLAWNNAPTIGGLRTILDLPAIIMSIFITGLVYIGIKETRNASNAMVILKMAIVAMVIVIGVFYVDPKNWHPFLPNGFGGVMAGVSSVFFAYIGFDAISTTAEECKNPQRDLPKAMIYSIVICTALYIVLALILTGMVNYKLLNVDDPLAFVFEKLGMPWISGVIAVSAVVAMAGVFLVFQMGQPRIWMTMSRDGLLPPRFAHIHPKYKTPDFATLMTAVFVIVPMLFISSDLVLDLCSMGTLFAFVLVCGGVLKLQITPNAPKGTFKTPYFNGKWIYPAMLATGAAIMYTNDAQGTMGWLRFEGGWSQFPMLLFYTVSLLMAYWTFKHSLSLIPVLGLVCCLYMMAQISAHSWLGFFIWLAIGLVIYFGYGYKHSRIARTRARA